MQNRQLLLDVLNDEFPGCGTPYQYQCYQQLNNKIYMPETITTIADKLSADARLELQSKVNAKLDFCTVDPHDGLFIPQSIPLKVPVAYITAAAAKTPDADGNVELPVPIQRFYEDLNKAMYDLNETPCINKKHSDFLQKVEESYPFVKP